MGQLTGVHGIAKEYLGRHQILGMWAPALADGLEWAVGRPVNPPDLDLAFYGHLFRQAPEGTAKGSKGDEAVAQLADLDAEEIAELSEAMKEIVSPADLAAAEAEAYKALMRLPARVLTLVGAFERRFPPASGILFLGALRQVRRYLRDPDLKAEVDRITARASADATVLIGHSLGSVVAYEFLRQHPGHSVKLLLTLGSPLGLRMVRERLPGRELGVGELGVTHWINVRDPRDPVAAAGALGRWYPGVPDRLAENGGDAHAAERYLSSRAVGGALVGVLPELAQ